VAAAPGTHPDSRKVSDHRVNDRSSRVDASEQIRHFADARALIVPQTASQGNAMSDQSKRSAAMVEGETDFRLTRGDCGAQRRSQQARSAEMLETSTVESTVLIPHRYNASAGAFIEAVHRAQNAASVSERRQNVSVARVWYDTLAENLRALKHEIADTRAWIGEHERHPLMPQMRQHLSCLSSDAKMLDGALTDLLLALSTAGDFIQD
jgi:hypothetical protein